MDAVRVAAVAALLLTALAAPGCGRPKQAPGTPPPPPMAMARVATLHVGVPRRANLLFTCDAAPADPKLGSAAYAPDSLDPTGRRWRRLPQADPDSVGALAPDTLIVRTYVDATDEEIALERGDLDVAVFWPGEPSAHMRADARFRDTLLGRRELGVVACVTGADDSLGMSRADMEALNREAFSGDLLPWSEIAPDSLDAPPARYTVDPAMPGAKHLARILGRIPAAGATRILRLVYVDAPENLYRITWPTRGLRGSSRYVPVFAVRCPVLVRPEFRTSVRLIGADAFAELAPCTLPGQR